jgi:hypothetical protein
MLDLRRECLAKAKCYITLGEFLHGYFLLEPKFKGLSCAFELLRNDVGSEGRRHVMRILQFRPFPSNPVNGADLIRMQYIDAGQRCE